MADINVIIDRIASIDKTKLSQNHQFLVKTAQKALDRFQKSGLKPEEFGDRRFFEDEEE